MVEICAKCGMPKDICVCEDIARESQKIRISSEKRRFGKQTTIITGFEKTINIKELAKEMKQKIACGGTAKEGKIELQGDHKQRIKDFLIKRGYNEKQIDLC